MDERTDERAGAPRQSPPGVHDDAEIGLSSGGGVHGLAGNAMRNPQDETQPVAAPADAPRGAAGDKALYVNPASPLDPSAEFEALWDRMGAEDNALADLSRRRLGLTPLPPGATKPYLDACQAVRDYVARLERAAWQGVEDAGTVVELEAELERERNAAYRMEAELRRRLDMVTQTERQWAVAAHARNESLQGIVADLQQRLGKALAEAATVAPATVDDTVGWRRRREMAKRAHGLANDVDVLTSLLERREDAGEPCRNARLSLQRLADRVREADERDRLADQLSDAARKSVAETEAENARLRRVLDEIHFATTTTTTTTTGEKE